MEEDGTIVDLTLKNFSSATEEDIKITFPQGYPITLIAASNGDVSADKNSLIVSRISGREEVSAVVHVSSQGFLPSQIISVNSNAVEGKIIVGKRSSSTESYTFGEWIQAVLALGMIFIFGMMASAFGGWTGLTNLPFNILMSGDTGGEYWEPKSSLLFSDYIKDAKSRRIPCRYSTPVINEDNVELEFQLENTGNEYIDIWIQLETNSEKQTYRRDSIETSIILAPGQKRNVVLKDNLPSFTPGLLVVECKWDYKDEIYTDVRKVIPIQSKN